MQFSDVILMVEGEAINAKVRHRSRQQIAKKRDLDRRAARELRREREYA